MDITQTDFNLYARKKNKKIYVLCFKNTGIFPTRAYQALKHPSLVFDILLTLNKSIKAQ